MNKVKRIYYENVSNNNANRILYTCYSSVWIIWSIIEIHPKIGYS
jgi:hypothetical protein